LVAVVIWPLVAVVAWPVLVVTDADAAAVAVVGGRVVLAVEAAAVEAIVVEATVVGESVDLVVLQTPTMPIIDGA
jgi:hypothetical protein